MGIQAAPEVKFALIREAALQDSNLLKISQMCEIAGVSRSGYHTWCASEPTRQRHEDADRKDFELILETYRYRGYAKGARGIHIRLLHYPGIVMNCSQRLGLPLHQLRFQPEAEGRRIYPVYVPQRQLLG